MSRADNEVSGDRRTDPQGLGLRIQIRSRVREQILAAIEKGNYDRVTVLGHSFGTIVATDVFPDLPVSSRAMRFVTIGSPIELLKRAQWLEKEVEILIASPVPA